jgi:hypothetical protein
MANVYLILRQKKLIGKINESGIFFLAPDNQ